MPLQRPRELDRLPRPMLTGPAHARHGLVVVARPARERDECRRVLRQAVDVAARPADHRGGDPAVAGETAREEDRPVAVMLEGGLAEVENDDAAVTPARGGATLLGEEPRLRGLLVDRDR